MLNSERLSLLSQPTNKINTSTTDKDGGADSAMGPDTHTQPDMATPDTAAIPDANAGSASEAGSSSAFVYFIKQTNGTTSATMASGNITVNGSYGTSGNAFKYVAPNYYGTASNGFIAFPTTMTGDFTISAEITITTRSRGSVCAGNWLNW